MATRQRQLRELRRLLIIKEMEVGRAELRLTGLETQGAHGAFSKQDRKVRNLKAEVKKLQSRIGKRETTMQKQQKEAASG